MRNAFRTLFLPLAIVAILGCGGANEQPTKVTQPQASHDRGSSSAPVQAVAAANEYVVTVEGMT